MGYEGKLYIVATPIGNLQDVTFRAIDVLGTVTLIVCEDTRVTSRLLQKYSIATKMIALNEFNEEHVMYDVLKRLETESVALVSDAGTPLVSDPGYKLVVEAKKRQIQVVPVPGPSALTAALSISGLATDKFVFFGFLPRSNGKALKTLESAKNLKVTVVLYESPHRIVETIKIIHQAFGDIEITLARELTKIYEEVNSKKASEWEEFYTTKLPKGEFVVLFSTKS